MAAQFGGQGPFTVLISPAQGMTPASNPENVKPISAGASCWCEGQMKQPLGLPYLDYYASYYDLLTKCGTVRCGLCQAALATHWSVLGSGADALELGERFV